MIESQPQRKSLHLIDLKHFKIIGNLDRKFNDDLRKIKRKYLYINPIREDIKKL